MRVVTELRALIISAAIFFNVAAASTVPQATPAIVGNFHTDLPVTVIKTMDGYVPMGDTSFCGDPDNPNNPDNPPVWKTEQGTNG